MVRSSAKGFGWRFFLLAVVMLAGVLFLARRPLQAFLGSNSVTGPSFVVVLQNARTAYFQKIHDPSVIRDYLNTHPVRKLQIGAGENNLEGWLNSDYIPHKPQISLDATERFPFEDESLDFIFSEHVIEHLPYEGGIAMFQECYRTLKKGGKVRMVTPDLKKYTAAVQDPNSEFSKALIQAKLEAQHWSPVGTPAVFILNRQVRDWGHQFLYDAATLRNSLEQCHFSEIKIGPPLETDEPAFKTAEARRTGRFAKINALEAMAVEAVKR